MIKEELLSFAEKIISSCVLRTRMRSPFFATLMLFAKIIPSDRVELCAIDGESLYYNPERLIQLSAKEQDGALVHAILHASLFHYEAPLACSLSLWNQAADIVVNGIIAKNDFLALVPGALRDKGLEDKPVAEVYEILMKQGASKSRVSPCFACAGEPLEAPLLFSPQEKIRLRAHWRQALQQALAVQRMQRQSQSTHLPEWLEQLVAQLEELNDDWRSALWRFLVKTPADFEGFDRRMLSRGFYLEDTRTDEVQVIFGVDFECGVDREQSAVFIDEINKILAAYPHLKPSIVFQHKALFGPFDPRERIPITPSGAHKPPADSFWSYVQQRREETNAPLICVYLTDGFGVPPHTLPDLPVLWLLLPGGCRPDKIAFGRAVRFLRLT